MINWIETVSKEFDHPAIILWRSVELKVIEEALNTYSLASPLLDIGCAEGKIASVLLGGRGLRIEGLDNSWELLKLNKQAEVYKGLALADACKLPYKNSSFGSIFSNCVLEHIPDSNAVLSEASRVLKTGGFFVFTVPSHTFGESLFFSRVFKSLGLKKAARWYEKKRNGMLNHFHCYDHTHWEKLLKAKGLTLTAHRYYLSCESVAFWDYVAFSMFVLQKSRVLAFLAPLFARSVSSRIRKCYNAFENSGSGGGLLIIARKDEKGSV